MLGHLVVLFLLFSCKKGKRWRLLTFCKFFCLMFCTPPTPFDLLPHKPEDPFGLSQTLKKRSKGNAELYWNFCFRTDFRGIFLNVNTKEENTDVWRRGKAIFPKILYQWFTESYYYTYSIALSTSILLSYCVKNTWCLKQMSQWFT